MTNRSMRLRKKLKVGEFVVLSFGVAIDLQAGMTPEQENAFWNEWVGDAVEANGMLYGGLNSGVATAEQGSTTDAQREVLAAWLKARSEVARYKVGPLTDSNPPWLRRNGWAGYDFESALGLDTTPWVTK